MRGIRRVGTSPLQKLHELNKASEFRTAVFSSRNFVLTPSPAKFLLVIEGTDISGHLLPLKPACELFGMPDLDPMLNLRPQGL